jgi:hypothetical protein
MTIEEKIELLKFQMNSEKIPESRQHNFIEFERNCGGILGGYMLNNWIWGLIHERAEWSTPNQIIAKYDKSADLWFLDCFEGHPSDTWSIDEKGAIYWCGSKKSDDYMEIVNAAMIDRNAQISVLNELEISAHARINIAHGMKKFNDVHCLEISNKSQEILNNIFGR